MNNVIILTCILKDVPEWEGKKGLPHARQALVRVKHGNITHYLFPDEQGC